MQIGVCGEFVRREKPSPSRLRRATSPGVRGLNKRLPLRVRGSFKLPDKPEFEIVKYIFNPKSEHNPPYGHPMRRACVGVVRGRVSAVPDASEGGGT